MEDSAEGSPVQETNDAEEMDVTERDKTEEKSNTDSDSSDDEEDLEKQAADLEKLLSENPYDYDSYIKLVKLKHELADLDGWRSTYERLSETFPIPAEKWLERIETEKKLATSADEKKTIVSLFEKAISDYLSVRVWIEYVRFYTETYPDDIDGTRSLFERAIDEAGMHVSESSELWDAYIEFERRAGNEKNVFDVYEHRFSVPLIGMDRVYIDFLVQAEKDQADFDKKAIEKTYRSASRQLEIVKPIHDAIVNAQDKSEIAKLYEEYIQNETDDPYRIITLYERAVAELPTYSDLWHKYCLFLIRDGFKSRSLNVCSRSIRNCPWKLELWLTKLRAMELFGQSNEDITLCFEKSLESVYDGPSHLSLWLAYVEHRRRRLSLDDPANVELLRRVFEKGCEFLDGWGYEGDPNCTLLRYRARIEASRFNDMQIARSLWTQIFERGYDKVASAWLELISLERHYGDAKKLRKTYARALERTEDWPSSIVESWVNYERDCGTIETMMTCLEACEKNAAKRKPETNVETEKNAEMETSDETSYRKRKLHETRKKNRDIPHVKKAKIEPPEKQITPVDPERDLKTVFVSNLDYSVDTDALSKWFGDSVVEVRLIKDHAGRSKGYCYVEFGSTEKATEALNRDREMLEGRPVFISRCEKEKTNRDNAFRYATTREPDKLFVKGLPRETTEDDLVEMFSRFGKLKEVRTVRFRNGISKGLAYIDFEDAASAAKAVAETDGKIIGGRTISVAISEPPQRDVPARAAASSAAPGPSNFSFGRSEKRGLFVPTVLRKSAAPAANGSDRPEAKSNADFRAMLLGKK